MQTTYLPFVTAARPSSFGRVVSKWGKSILMNNAEAVILLATGGWKDENGDDDGNDGGCDDDDLL